jgi:hypothetical protein
MPLPIHVDEYSGHRANQRPRSFTVDEQVFDIDVVLDQWHELSGTYFKVQTTERKVYLRRYDGEGDEWTLQSGFDGDELFARPSIEFITVGPEGIHRAERGRCLSNHGRISFSVFGHAGKTGLLLNHWSSTSSTKAWG